MGTCERLSKESNNKRDLIEFSQDAINRRHWRVTLCFWWRLRGVCALFSDKNLATFIIIIIIIIFVLKERILLSFSFSLSLSLYVYTSLSISLSLSLSLSICRFLDCIQCPYWAYISKTAGQPTLMCPSVGDFS